MLLLGFSSGLPFYLTGNTLGFWLRDEGTSLTAIGFLSWVGIAYSIKPLYAPVIDRSDVPLFGRLGRRRGWMLAAQLTICFGLIAMSVIGPHGGLTLLGSLDEFFFGRYVFWRGEMEILGIALYADVMFADSQLIQSLQDHTVTSCQPRTWTGGSLFGPAACVSQCNTPLRTAAWKKPG